MRLIKQGALYVAQSTYAEKDVPSSAKFWWHSGNCWQNCKACAGGLPLKIWWTPDKEKAAKLRQYADPALQAELDGIGQAHEAKLVASRATAANVEIPCPAGLAYLPYQKAGIAALASRPNSLLADEMGLGKTIQALGAINLDTTIKTVLVVCPATLRMNWLREAQKWLTRAFSFHIVEKTDGTLPEGADFVIVNYEKARMPAVHATLMAREWDTLIIDECHRCKNPRAKQTKAILGYETKS